jgi:hypothetical protein
VDSRALDDPDRRPRGRPPVKVNDRRRHNVDIVSAQDETPDELFRRYNGPAEGARR